MRKQYEVAGLDRVYTSKSEANRQARNLARAAHAVGVRKDGIRVAEVTTDKRGANMTSEDLEIVDAERVVPVLPASLFNKYIRLREKHGKNKLLYAVQKTDDFSILGVFDSMAKAEQKVKTLAR